MSLDPLLSRLLDQTIQLSQARQQRAELSLANTLLQAATDGFGNHAPTCQQRRHRLDREGLKAIYDAQRMRQMLIKALTKQGFVKYLILPGAALHINSAFPELLY